MKRLILFLFALSLQAATYYVASASSSPAGNDSNNGSIGAPWLTLNHAMQTIACGDTVNIVADGNRVAGDSNIPYLSGCSSTTTIQSSKTAMLQPVGYRTNPASDSANYGKLTMTGQGIWAQVEGHGSYSSGCLLTTLSSDTFTLGFCNIGWITGNVSNGTAIFLEVANEGFNTAATVPAGLTTLTHYYIVNCSSCTGSGGTFKLAATPGGAAITGLTCNSPSCVIGAVRIYEPLQVNTSADTITSPDTLSVMGTNTPIYFSAASLQLSTLTTPAAALPSPLQLDTLYYMVNVSGRQFQVATSPGGSAIDLTTVGTGGFSMSDSRAPNHFKFDGLELMQAAGHAIFGGMFIFGSGNEASTLGMVNNMEVGRTWIHEDPSQEGQPTGPQRGIFDNSATLSVHDNYIAGMTNGEANGIAGCGSPGPTTVTNNFIEASGENILYGGCNPASGIANANKTFTGNYFYKPPAWRINAFAGVPSGACWYDNYDPNHTGGQWYTNTNTGQVYRCNSSGVWATTGSSVPAAYTVKTVTEHKNGRVFTYNGNVYAYNWPQAQSGQAFNIGQQQGSGPGIANDTIVITNNKLTHLNMFLNFGESCFLTVAIPCVTLPTDFTVRNNLAVMEQIACGVPSVGGTGDCGHQMYTMQSSGYPPANMTWDHNTIFITPDGFASAFPWFPAAAFLENTPGQGLMNNWVYKNSIMGYDWNGDGSACGGHISAQFTNSTFDHLANANAGCGSYSSVGATNTFTNWSPQSTNAAIGFTNLSTGDYHLSASSPYSAVGGCTTFCAPDGSDIGADIDKITAETSGALIGAPKWATRENFVITPGVTTAVATYTRPGSGACSLTLYNSPARISANENADTNTSGEKLDTRAGNTLVGANVTFNLGFNTALSPSTTYYYALSCVAADSSTWLLAGDSFTTQTGVSITTTCPMPDGLINAAYSPQTLTGTGGPLTWSITSGSLPTGLALITDTISGTPTVAGTSTFTLHAANGGDSADKSCTITINNSSTTSHPGSVFRSIQSRGTTTR